jgi:hypothetical protein
MKSKLLLGVVSVSILALSGCASSPGSKSSASSKESKALTPQDIAARYKKTIYGKDGVRKQSMTTMKGTFSLEQFGIEGPFVVYATAPDGYVTIVEAMGMQLNTGCSKGVCWTQQPGQGTTTLSGEVAALQLQQSDYNMWDHPDRYYTSMEIVVPPAGKDSPNNQIKGVKKSGDVDFYEFSKESGLLVSALLEGQTAQGHMQIGLQFKNYKDFGGTLVPTEVTQSTPQATIKLTFNEVSYAPITDDKFVKPN